MWPFKKKKILDLTEKAKIPESVRSRLATEYKDLASSSAPASADSTSTPESALGFLGNLANSVSSDSTTSTSDLPIDKLSLKHLKV
jgi:hypothetical protein